MIDKIIAELDKHKQIMITSHIIPDGDSIGSMIAMGLALEALGKEITLVNNDRVPEQYQFLKGSEAIQLPSTLKASPSLCIAVDLTGLDRVGDTLQNFIHREKPVIINIDHHVSNQYFGQINFVDADAAAAGQIVYELIAALNIPLTVDIASALYVAIATDTGSFQYESTRPRTMEITARLLEAGINPGKINQLLYDNQPLVKLRLLEKVLPTLTVSEDGKVAYMWVDLKTMHKLGADNEHCDGLVNYPRSLRGVEVALFFRQIAKNKIKVAFRSKGKADVNDIAGKFGGGGHAKAAGCTMTGTLPEVIRKVVTVTQQEVNKN